MPDGASSNGWKRSYRILVAVATLFPLAILLWYTITRVDAVAQVPAKVDSLRMAHDTQTSILREQLKLQRCLVIYGQAGCVALARQGDP